MDRRGVPGRLAVAVGAAGLLLAAGARRPVIRRWPASVLQAAPCMPASEAPDLVVAATGVAGLAALAGTGRTRLMGAGLNAAALLALAGLRGDAARSGAAYDRALAGLVPAAEPVVRPTARRPARRRYLRAEGIAYGDHPAQLLDVWGPAAPTSGAPVLVQVHGGGWTGGSRRFPAGPLLAHLVERGWVCVTVDYRLGPHERWPAMITDVKRAVAWVRAHVAEYGGDPRFVALGGGSAGGHLASLAGLTANDPAFQPGFTDADTAVDAVVAAYGVHDFSRDEHGLFALLEHKVIGTTHLDDADTWRAASPLHRAHAGAPPHLVVHGSSDTIVAVGQSRRFVARMREVGAEVYYAELPHAQHGFDAYASARTAQHVRGVHRFLTAVHHRSVNFLPSSDLVRRN